jgi:hypothetical protein
MRAWPLPELLAFAGALRTQSWNKKLDSHRRAIARDAGAEVSLIDLRDYPMPFYDAISRPSDGLAAAGTRAQGADACARCFSLELAPSTTARSAQCSRTRSTGCRGPAPNEPSAFKGKIAGLLAASPATWAACAACSRCARCSRLWRARGADPVRVEPGRECFAEDGNAQGRAHRDAVRAVVTELVSVTSRLSAMRPEIVRGQRAARSVWCAAPRAPSG